MKRIAYIVLMAITVMLLCACGKSKNEVYRGIFWGMTQEEVAEMERARGNTIVGDGNYTESKIVYTVKDLITSDNDFNRCSYIFEGENGTLSSFTISSLLNGEELTSYIEKDLTKMYGESEHEEISDNGETYGSFKWVTEHEIIEGITFSSSLFEEAYFTFTMIEKEG